MKKYKRKENKRLELKDKIIERKTNEIEHLKELVTNLKISCEEKDEIIYSIDSLRKEYLDIINDLKAQSKEYRELIDDVMEMRDVLNQNVFNGEWKWKLIKQLMK